MDEKKNANKSKVQITDAQGVLVAEINKPQYTTIPVDFETKADVLWLCMATGGNRRSQGAMVKKLVKAEIKRMRLSKA